MIDEFHVIAHIRTDFSEKFGIPRQSGLVPSAQGKILFEPEYRDPLVIRGIEGFDYLWLLWKFENTSRELWQPTVRPPRLGGNKHMGVFATRSPFRPNPIGLSSVRLEAVEQTSFGPVLHVSGVDLRDQTPIYDIKPYLSYTDSHENVKCGFADDGLNWKLNVDFSKKWLRLIPQEKQKAALELLEQDPRPAYHHDSKRFYGVLFAGYQIHFVVVDMKLRVVEVEQVEEYV